MRYAEVTDIENGWRSLSTTEQNWAAQLLDAAGAWITDRVEDPDAVADRAAFVSIDVVRNALAPGSNTGLSSFSKTIGPWSKSGTLVNPQGLLTFTEFHRDLLGIVAEGSQPLFNFPEDDY